MKWGNHWSTSNSCSNFIELVIQEGKMWTVILVDTTILKDLTLLDQKIRERVLECRRKSDTKFMTEDAKVLVKL